MPQEPLELWPQFSLPVRSTGETVVPSAALFRVLVFFGNHVYSLPNPFSPTRAYHIESASPQKQLPNRLGSLGDLNSETGTKVSAEALTIAESRPKSFNRPMAGENDPFHAEGSAIATQATTGPRYKDSSAPIADRVADLLSRMTLAEKAGQMFHDMVLNPLDLTTQGPKRVVPSAESKVQELQMSHFNLLGAVNDARRAATWYNTLQSFAVSQTRLGIPVTMSTDPRNHFKQNIGTSFRAGKLSQWPETLGLAALRDEALVEKFADIARREYVAIGLRCALSPQIDLATEYRWARIDGTFGEDADLSGRLAQAYIRGFQASSDGTVGTHSVSCMTKHFPGAGPQKDGEDAHFVYGKDQVYPGGHFEYHLRPFRKAIEAGSRQMMPYYGKPVGLQGDYSEEVGFAFHKGIITKLLREELGFDGIVCTDWGLITDATILGQDMPARAWGCEQLSEIERVVKILDAGCDQFGGESRPELVVEAVHKGLVSESRIDQSVRRLLTEKFALGLFDAPFVDVDEAERVVGHPDFVLEANKAQRRSYTLLVNRNNNTLPLKRTAIQNKRFYLENVDREILTSRHGPTIQTVARPEDADIALIRLRAPYEPRPGGFEANFHAGSLEFPPQERSRQKAVYSRVPVSIVDIHLDRPAVIGEIAGQVDAMLVSYGSSDAAFLDVVFGVDGCGPEGRLPFDLPSSMAAVSECDEDSPYSTRDPAFKFGSGLRYCTEQ
ncbi:Glycosyl hydrolase family 3 domain-containing protein [Cladophialophora immunda]|nr:Glycosyl hydrolase family 3 domain-containing protein [Cladophialophora immunda]